MNGLEGQRADSHGLLTAQQHGAYPLPGHTDTLEYRIDVFTQL